MDVLRTEGVTHLFGNPGTTELPLVDALAGVHDLAYVLALQEATAVGMADGYAQVTGRPAFLNLHTSAGLGNAIGNLTNAVANRTPLVVTAGQQDYRHIVTDPLLSDRKSTRLNSSHLVISYAVFCLKKKTREQ